MGLHKTFPMWFSKRNINNNLIPVYRVSRHSSYVLQYLTEYIP